MKQVKKERMNDYQLAKSVVQKLNIGDVEMVEPSDIEDFRRYLTIVSKKKNMKFTTKSHDGKLLVARIERPDVFDKF